VGGGGLGSDKLSHKIAIKHEKGGPLDFLRSLNTPLKIIWPKIPRTPHWISNYSASMIKEDVNSFKKMFLHMYFM
jgi:hypothetical protein